MGAGLFTVAILTEVPFRESQRSVRHVRCRVVGDQIVLEGNSRSGGHGNRLASSILASSISARGGGFVPA